MDWFDNAALRKPQRTNKNNPMPAYKRRKRLTERVADRQAGRDVDPESTSRKWARNLSTLGYALSLIGLGLLAYEAMQMAQGAILHIPTIVVYAGLFIGGRLIKKILDTARPFM
jgi:hypothetical protein